MRNVVIAKSKLDRVVEQIGDREITVPVMIRYLNKEFRSMSIRFKSRKSDFLSISGYYAGDIQEDGDRRYNIFLTYTEQDKRIRINKNFYNYLFSCVVHELRHGYQDRKYRRRVKPGRVTISTVPRFEDVGFAETFFYLADPDELDAYAYEVAYAKIHFNGKHRHKWIINRYRKTFKDIAPDVYHRFLNKVYKFSQRMIDDNKNKQLNTSC